MVSDAHSSSDAALHPPVRSGLLAAYPWAAVVLLMLVTVLNNVDRFLPAILAEPMKRWELEDLIPTTELLVSELVTNAVRYSRGEITLRLVNEKALVCEVLDNSGALPRLRQASSEDENGRGLQVVRQLSQRWGARRTATGKVVWCEQPLPGRAAMEEPQPFH